MYFSFVCSTLQKQTLRCSKSGIITSTVSKHTVHRNQCIMSLVTSNQQLTFLYFLGNSNAINAMKNVFPPVQQRSLWCDNASATDSAYILYVEGKFLGRGCVPGERAVPH